MANIVASIVVMKKLAFVAQIGHATNHISVKKAWIFEVGDFKNF